MIDITALEQPEERIQAIAAQISSALGLTTSNAEWANYRFTADAPPVQLHLDDLSGIPFLDNVAGVERYQLRARVRARQGDMFAATVPDMPDYEAYNVDTLGLGSARFVHADGGDSPIQVARACAHGSAFEELTSIAESLGGLTIHPYMGIQGVYDLARKLQEAAAVPVNVLAPPPAVTWYANDKIHLHHLVTELLGPDYVVDTSISSTPEGLASDLLRLSSKHSMVAWKMARCASAMGNLRYVSDDIRGWTLPDAVAAASDFLAEKQWVPGDEVLTVAWEDTDCSPSTQLWIPPLGEGEITVDGCYEQLLIGPERMFLGSVPSRLPAEVNSEMACVSIQVARVYQQMGYVGRCSFDFIRKDGHLRFVECNGRWGGTSTPMHLVDRVVAGGRPAYRACDIVENSLVGAPFSEVARRLGDSLYVPATGQGKFLVYNIGPLQTHGKFDVVALGDSYEAASHALEIELPTLIQA